MENRDMGIKNGRAGLILPARAFFLGRREEAKLTPPSAAGHHRHWSQTR
jgi:hypothetical protein